MTSKTRRASRSTSGPMPSPGNHAMSTFMDRNQILIFNSLFTIGNFEELHICLLDLLARERVTELAIPGFQRVTARMLSQDDLAPRYTDAIRRHDFVRHRVLQHSILMNTSF